MRYTTVTMKYRVTKTHEDKEILKRVSIRSLAKKIKCNPSFLYRLKNGEKIATEEMYTKIKTALEQ